MFSTGLNIIRQGKVWFFANWHCGFTDGFLRFKCDCYIESTAPRTNISSFWVACMLCAHAVWRLFWSNIRYQLGLQGKQRVHRTCDKIHAWVQHNVQSNRVYTMNREARSSVDIEICQYWYFSPVCTHSGVYSDIIWVYKGIFVCRLTINMPTSKKAQWRCVNRSLNLFGLFSLVWPWNCTQTLLLLLFHEENQS